jgi:hypothetical protein
MKKPNLNNFLQKQKRTKKMQMQQRNQMKAKETTKKYKRKPNLLKEEVGGLGHLV